MSDIDKDLQRRLRDFADRVSPEPGRGSVVVRSARTKRRLVALSAGLAVALALGGLAGAATLLGDRDGIKPAPGPEQTRLTHHDLAPLGVDQLADALFRDHELADAVPTEAGFSLTQIIRHGPDQTKDDYATVGVQMEGPVDYSRVNFFVHPSERDAAAMGIRRSELLRLDWKAQRDEGVKPFAAANALPGTQCGLVYGQLLSCHAVVGRVLVLTQSGDEGASPPQVTDKELDAAMTLIRSFGSYLKRIYPQPANQAERDCSGAEPPPASTRGGLRLRPRQEGSNEVVPIVFPDGTTAELVYLSDMSSDALTVPFDELVARPYPAGGPEGKMIRPQIFYGGIPAEYEAENMVDCIDGRDGPVPVWDSKEGDLIDLVFGQWHVVIFDGREAQEVWARELQGEVVDGGWLVLRGGENLAVGPENDPGDANLMLTLDRTILSLWVLDCEERRKSDSADQLGEDFISYCLEDVDIEVHVQGAPEFVHSVYRNLEVRKVKRTFPLSMYTLLP